MKKISENILTNKDMEYIMKLQTRKIKEKQNNKKEKEVIPPKA